MSDQQIITPDGAVGSTFETALEQVEKNEMLSLRWDEDSQSWYCSVHELARHELTRFGKGPTPQAAIIDLHPLHYIKRAKMADEGEWTTEDPLSPEELAELDSDPATS